MTILLVDGDEVLYQTLNALEVETEWSPDVWTLTVNVADARETLSAKIRRLQEQFQAQVTLLGFTSPDNWRKQVYPPYKANRTGKRKPVGYKQLKDEALQAKGWAAQVGAWGAVRPTLEGDDILGILATKPANRGRAVIVSQDKDFLSVPSKLWRNGELLEITEEAADRAHLIQALSGDPADGYPGCPGIGKETAGRLLEAGEMFVKAGSRWERRPSPSPWETVLSCYRKADLTEEHAITQARVARILRWGEWDKDKQEVRLWHPAQASS